MYCKNCGKEMNEYGICTNCGWRYSAVQTRQIPKRKNTLPIVYIMVVGLITILLLISNWGNGLSAETIGLEAKGGSIWYLLYGKQYAYEKNGAPITEGHMVMGVKDAEIKDVVTQLNGDYSIYGANFTKQSKVYINDEKQDTKFMNNTRLDLKDSELKDGDTIMVAQVGSSNTIFRTSKTYEYKDGKLSEVVETDDSVENGRQAFTDQEEKKD